MNINFITQVCKDKNGILTVSSFIIVQYILEGESLLEIDDKTLQGFNRMMIEIFKQENIETYSDLRYLYLK